MHFNPTIPAGLVLMIGGLLLVLTVAIYWTTASRLKPGQKLFLLALRLLGTAGIILLLLQPSRKEEIPRPRHNRAVIVAIDSSQSMSQADEGGASRIDTARQILRDNGLLDGSGTAEIDLRFFQFDEDARSLTSEAVERLQPEGETTRFHQSIASMIKAVSDADIEALVVMSDGHDFEMEPANRTAALARQKHFPIFAIPLGNTGKVRDVAVRIDNYQPYVYVNQKAEISARLRLIGFEYQTLNVQLLRNGKLVATQTVSSGDESEIPLVFSIKEPETGQFQYEVKVALTQNDDDGANNNAFTYLNVIDEKIRILILEGSPYWDTTFLQRSLLRNDKIDMDAILSFAAQRARRIRSDPNRGELNFPSKPEDFREYDAVILGRSLERLTDPTPLSSHLINFVSEAGGTLIFARGRALGDDDDRLMELEPVFYENSGNRNVRFNVAPGGRGLAAFQLVQDHLKSTTPLPPLLAARKTVGSKPLASTLAEVQDPDTGQSTPVFVHRPVGNGQVLNINVAGLWKWSFNAKSEVENNLFDRFWDQLLIWLLSQSDAIPNQEYSFRVNRVNIQLGEPVDFRFKTRKSELFSGLEPLHISRDGVPVTVLKWNQEPSGSHSLLSQFVPEATGHYEAKLRLPNGETLGQKFMVIQERAEMTEVATDLAYLTRLCQLSGGTVLDRSDLGQLSRTFDLNRHKQEGDEPETRSVPIWDKTWVFLLILMLFAADWMMRRRWGLT